MGCLNLFLQIVKWYLHVLVVCSKVSKSETGIGDYSGPPVDRWYESMRPVLDQTSANRHKNGGTNREGKERNRGRVRKRMGGKGGRHCWRVGANLLRPSEGHGGLHGSVLPNHSFNQGRLRGGNKGTRWQGRHRRWWPESCQGLLWPLGDRKGSHGATAAE